MFMKNIQMNQDKMKKNKKKILRIIIMKKYRVRAIYLRMKSKNYKLMKKMIIKSKQKEMKMMKIKKQRKEKKAHKL